MGYWIVLAVFIGLIALNPLGMPCSHIGYTPSRTYFADYRGRAVSTYMLGDTIFVTVEDPDKNHHENLINVITRAVKVINLRTGQSVIVDLTETGPNTGTFLSDPITTGIAGSGAMLEVYCDDALQAIYIDPDNPADLSEAQTTMGCACFPDAYFGNSPNPFSSSTKFFVVLGCRHIRHIKVEVYNLTGQIVFVAEKDGNSLIWDGADLAGRRLASGVYLYILTVTGEAQTLRLRPMRLIALRGS